MSALDDARFEFIERNTVRSKTNILLSFIVPKKKAMYYGFPHYSYSVRFDEHRECCAKFDSLDEYDFTVVVSHLQDADHIATKYSVDVHDVMAAWAAIKLILAINENPYV